MMPSANMLEKKISSIRMANPKRSTPLQDSEAKDFSSEPTAAAMSSNVPTSSSSRILVKNLPKYIDEQRLSKHFSSVSSSAKITDLKLIKTKNGNSR